MCLLLVKCHPPFIFVIRDAEAADFRDCIRNKDMFTNYIHQDMSTNLETANSFRIPGCDTIWSFFREQWLDFSFVFHYLECNCGDISPLLFTAIDSPLYKYIKKDWVAIYKRAACFTTSESFSPCQKTVDPYCRSILLLILFVVRHHVYSPTVVLCWTPHAKRGKRSRQLETCGRHCKIFVIMWYPWIVILNCK